MRYDTICMMQLSAMCIEGHIISFANINRQLDTLQAPTATHQPILHSIHNIVHLVEIIQQ